VEDATMAARITSTRRYSHGLRDYSEGLKPTAEIPTGSPFAGRRAVG